MAKGDERQGDPAREGLEHLQAAAREMIAAARSMLDACEELLEDPATGAGIAAMVGSVARAVGGITGLGGSGGVRTPGAGDDAGRVQHIKIS